jgi:hypothetical protein
LFHDSSQPPHHFAKKVGFLTHAYTLKQKVLTGASGGLLLLLLEFTAPLHKHEEHDSNHQGQTNDDYSE